MSVKSQLIKYVKDRIFDNDQELITGQAEQDVFIEFINKAYIPGDIGKISSKLVIDSDGTEYRLSNGGLGEARFFKIDLGDDGQPLPEKFTPDGYPDGFSDANVLITYLNSL